MTVLLDVVCGYLPSASEPYPTADDEILRIVLIKLSCDQQVFSLFWPIAKLKAT